MQQAGTPRPAHRWIRGGARPDRAAAVRELPLPPGLTGPLDAHRRLRGPFTAAGTLARALTPLVLPHDPELVKRYDIELLSVAPELRSLVPGSRETLTSMALPAERTRFYARLRTRRIGHGMTEFTLAALPLLDAPGPRCLVVENAEHADPTDAEFLAALLRRTDPAVLTVVVCTGDGTGPGEPLAAALAAHTVPLAVAGGTAPAGQGPTDAWEFVRGACLEEYSPGAAAYAALDDRARAGLHDRRAGELLGAEGTFSQTLGALPFHAERGAEPAGAVEILWRACDHCLVNGFYDAVVDYGRRGHALTDGPAHPRGWWRFGVQTGLALSILGRTEEAEAIYDTARLLSTDPAVHMSCAYSTAMLYTRHNDPADRDEHRAKSLLNGAIATAGLLPGRVERAFQSAFYKNGRALVEINLGDPQEALRLVNECIADLDTRLEPHEHRLHRSVLKNNRARVLLALGRLDEALADYAVVVEQDPNHAEHYLERGNILRRLGREAEALEDYARAIRLSPPFPEIHYNRGDLHLTLGDQLAALADFDYVIELDPEFTDAYINRAGIRLESGDVDGALADAEAGLRLDPACAHLHVVVGQVLAEREEHAGAEAAFDQALAAEPDLVSALCGRAAARWEQGLTDGSLSDLTRAVEVDGEDPALRYNRGYLLLETGRWHDALPDLERAATLAPDDHDIAEALAGCRHHLTTT